MNDRAAEAAREEEKALWDCVDRVRHSSKWTAV